MILLYSSLIKEYYEISFIHKDSLKNNFLWVATNVINEEDMLYMGKEINQEEI